MRAVAQRHEGQQRPVVVGGGVGAIVDTDPGLDFGASGSCVSCGSVDVRFCKVKT